MICLGILLAVPPVQGQNSVVNQTVSNQSASRPKLHIRSRSSLETVKVLPGLSARLFASQLGDISAMTLDEDGTLYVSDQKRGRIYKLSDRALDGHLDSTRIIWRDLEEPSGLAVQGQTLYIADARAVWASPLGSQRKTQVASLRNANALASPRPLLVSGTGEALFLGLSSGDGTGRLISIEVETRKASLAASGEGGISALARASGDQIWIGSANRAVPVAGGKFDYSRGIQVAEGNSVTGLVLPGQYIDQNEALIPYQDHILAAQGGALQWNTPAQEGLNVLTIPTRFGRAVQGTEVLASGFAASSGRSAWGQPGAMVMDERGLFIADRWSGSIWLVTGAPLIPEPVIAIPEALLDEEVKQVPTEKDPHAANPQGSLILKGSMIEKGTLLEQGSTIPEDEDSEDGESKFKDKKKRGTKGAPPDK